MSFSSQNVFKRKDTIFLNKLALEEKEIEENLVKQLRVSSFLSGFRWIAVVSWVGRWVEKGFEASSGFN